MKIFNNILFILISISCINTGLIAMECDDNYTTAQLFRAIELGDFPLVEALCPYVNLRQRNREQRTVLQVAIMKGNTYIALWLLENYGAQIDLKNKDSLGDDALFSAVTFTQTDIVRQLLKRDTSTLNNPVFGHQTLLEYAISKQSPSIVKELLDAGARINLHEFNFKKNNPIRLALQAIKSANNQFTFDRAIKIYQMAFDHGLTEQNYKDYSSEMPDVTSGIFKDISQSYRQSVTAYSNTIPTNEKRPKKNLTRYNHEPLPLPLPQDHPGRYFRTTPLRRNHPTMSMLLATINYAQHQK